MQFAVTCAEGQSAHFNQYSYGGVKFADFFKFTYQTYVIIFLLVGRLQKKSGRKQQNKPNIVEVGLHLNKQYCFKGCKRELNFESFRI